MKTILRLRGMLCLLNKLLKIQHILALLLVFISISVQSTFAQQGSTRKVTGKVVSTSGNVLNGATVKIRNANQVTNTNEKGEFSLSYNKVEGVLDVSFLGYLTKSIKLEGTSTNLIISLVPDENLLSDVDVVVSTGYQDFNIERFVGSVSKLDSTSFHRRAGMNIIERLKGTVTGLQFGKESNSTGQRYPIIRGISTLGSFNKPLIVVDNFPMDERFDLNTINSNDVQDITVLKDAVAASIWGSAAGNGVIMITTKKGKFNQPFRISANSNTGIIEKPDFYYYPRMSIDEVIDIERFLFDKGFYKANLDNQITRPIISPVVELLSQMTESNKEVINQEIDALRKQDIRQDLDQYLYQNAIRQQHHISIGGGNSFGAYAF